MNQDLLQRIKAELAGRFTIDRELRAGAYGTVFEARDATDRVVALKVLRTELVHDRDRTLRELGLISRLRHPNVLPIFEAGAAAGSVFYTMPLITGESVERRLRRGPIPLDETLQIARDVGEALGYAAAHGVLHRDVTPHQILLDNGQTLVKDFWIARAMSRAAGENLTTSGIVVGTPGYMSPEQLSGMAVDARSDVYSLAVLIVEMITNKPVFTGDSPVKIIARQVAGPPLAVKDLPPGLPKEIAEAVVVALDPDRNRRYGSALELIDACEGRAPIVDGRFAGGQPRAVKAPVPEKQRRPRSTLQPRVALGVSLIALLMIVGVVQMTQGNFPVAGALGGIILLGALRRDRGSAPVAPPVVRPPRARNRIDRLREALRYQYDIERELGRGGMAEVYLAEDLRYRGRRVAIKVLRAEFANSDMSERFVEEIQITARFSHPSIVPLLDSGDADGRPYYVMPFIEGETLNDRLQRDGALAVHDMIEITRGVARALEYAHRQQVVHRDIKPENILLHEGQASVADFGIALALDRARDKRLTGGRSIGTPAYMSPEQFWDPMNIGHRSDIYSLGCVMCEMLTGKPPYDGDLDQLALQHRQAPIPDLRQRRADIPDVLCWVIQTCLAKAPEQRFQSAAALIGALEAGAGGLPPSVFPQQPQHGLLS